MLLHLRLITFAFLIVVLTSFSYATDPKADDYIIYNDLDYQSPSNSECNDGADTFIANYKAEHTEITWTNVWTSVIGGEGRCKFKWQYRYHCPSGEIWDTNTTQCVNPNLPPECPNNQIFYDGNCTSCPANAHKVDATTCACNLAGTPDDNGVCPVPHCNDLEYYNPPTDHCEQCDCANSCHYDASANLGYVCEAGDTGDDNTDDNNTTPTDDNDTPPSDDAPQNDCTHPPGTPTNPFFGYCFNTIVNDPYNCNETYQLQNCDQGDFACYTVCPPTDTNNTDDNNTDDSGTGGDSDDDGGTDGTMTDENSTTINIDTTSMENKLDDIAAALGRDGQINKSLADIGNMINTTNNNLGARLDDVSDAINNIGKSKDGSSAAGFIPNDRNVSFSVNEDRVNEINQKVNDLTEQLDTATGLIDSVKTEFSTFSIHIQNAYTSLTTDYANVRGMFDDRPQVSVPSGGSCDLSASLWGGNIEFGTKMCQYFRSISSSIVFVFSLATQLTLIYLSILLFKKD